MFDVPAPSTLKFLSKESVDSSPEAGDKHIDFQYISSEESFDYCT
jgi:hypothetical protein